MADHYVQQSSECDYLFKVLLIGNSGVGKSCMLMRFSENQFTNHFYNTIGVDFKIKVFQVDKSKVKLQIWDTAGQDRFRTITSSYYRGAQGIIIVFDVTDRESFDQVRSWMSEIDKFAQEQVNKILIGNKVDTANRRVGADEAEALARSYGIPYVETSAKNNINIDQCFTIITRLIIKRVPVPQKNETKQVGMKLHQQNESEKQKTKQAESNQCCPT